MIKKTAAGIYSYMPMGWRTIRKIEQIVREEMDAKGAEEIYTQSVQPAELWKESGRWDAYGPEMWRLKDRNAREFCLGPTAGGGFYGSRKGRCFLAQTAAADALSDYRQIQRRGASALRHDAFPRLHHEGQLFF